MKKLLLLIPLLTIGYTSEKVFKEIEGTKKVGVDILYDFENYFFDKIIYWGTNIENSAKNSIKSPIPNAFSENNSENKTTPIFGFFKNYIVEEIIFYQAYIVNTSIKNLKYWFKNGLKTKQKNFLPTTIKNHLKDENNHSLKEKNIELNTTVTSKITKTKASAFISKTQDPINAKTFRVLNEDFNMHVSGIIEGGSSDKSINRDVYLTIDNAIKKITVIGSNKIGSNKRYISFRKFNIFVDRKQQKLTVDSEIALFNDYSEENYKTISCIKTYDIPYDNNIVLYYNNYDNKLEEQCELIIDCSVFKENTQYILTADNLIKGNINYSKVAFELQTKVNGYAFDEYGKHDGNQFALERGLNFIRIVGNKEGEDLYITRFEKTKTDFIIEGFVKDPINNKTEFKGVISNSDFKGTINPNLIIQKGINYLDSDFGTEIEIDADYLNKHYNNKRFKINFNNITNKQIPHSPEINEIILASRYSFNIPGYADYRGNWYEKGSYRKMNIGIKLPRGTERIVATGGFDKNANILFGDINGQLIHDSYALQNKDESGNDDGTKYSGDDIIEKIEIKIPDGAHYVHMSTLKSKVSTSSLKAVGNFTFEDKNNAKSIQSIILDKTKPNGVYYTGKYVFRKNSININEVEILDGNNLETADTYSSSQLIKGQGKGQLVYYKNNKYYFYNGSSRTIYYEENGVRKNITSPTIHPTVWANAGGQQQERTVIEVLEDGSILFNMKEKQENGNMFYSLWKWEKDKVPEKKFIYSNTYFTKSDNSIRSANGCPLGSWSFAYAEGLIFATEYGQGTSKWWFDQNKSGGNGKGVSSKVWVSNDNGDTWRICLNLNEKKYNNLPESDDNWKYFTSTKDKNFCHIHLIRYDNYDKRIYVSNGDGENYLWSIGVKEVKDWIENSTLVLPNAFPDYFFDTNLTWNSVRLCTSRPQPNINYHNMKFQMTALFPIEQGLLMGHDAPREFMYIAHRKGILKQETIRFEPSYNWENNSDFDAYWKFKNSQDRTDGFVMAIERFGESEPILTFHSASGKYSRIWATYNGFNHRVVFESENKGIVAFGCRVFHRNDGSLIISTGVSESTNNSGYYILNVN